MSETNTIQVSSTYGSCTSKTAMEYELALFTRKIVETCFKYYNIVQDIHKAGRSPFKLLNVICLLVFGNIQGITSTVRIASNSEYHELYHVVSDTLIISDRRLRDYRLNYKEIFQKILSITLILAYCLSITEFKHLAIDGTILKAFNSPFNILKMKDIDLLIKHYTKKELSEDEFNKLRESAQDFINNVNFTVDEKIEILKMLKEILENSNQTSIGINDETARWMYNKKHKKQLSFNVQHAVDSKSVLICGVNVTQSPTDHYQIPDLMEISLDNLCGVIPDEISADTIYRTIYNLTYLEDKDITGLIPTRKQGKESINNLNKNPFSSDYFPYDPIKKVVVCPNNNELKRYGPYDCKPDKLGYQRQQFAFSNYKACQNCKDREECCNGGHRTITKYSHELLDKTEALMELKENKVKYKYRSIVEGPNGTYRIFYHIDEFSVTGIEKIQGLMDGIAASFNIKRLFNIIFEKQINWDDVYKVMDMLVAPSSNLLCNMGLFNTD